MLELESPTLPISSTAPPSLSQPVALLSVFEGDLRRKPTLEQPIILHLTLVESQYTKVNFSYQSGLFSYDYFLLKLVLLGDCVIT